MSWFASDDELAKHEFHDTEDDWRLIHSEEKEFVDVATHVGNYSIIRIILPSGAWWGIDDAERIRDALTRQIDYAKRESGKAS